MKNRLEIGSEMGKNRQVIGPIPVEGGTGVIFDDESTFSVLFASSSSPDVANSQQPHRRHRVHRGVYAY